MDETLHFLVGATASGKTAVALELAERAGAEIVSMDSMLVYRGLDIGAAKPTARERARVPHHGLDLVDPSESFSVNDYLAHTRAALDDIARRGRRAVIVGGTSFYLKALVQGLFQGPDVDAAVREQIEERYRIEGPDALHAELERVDPRLAQRIHRNDRKRVVRALEVYQQTGKPLSEWQNEWGWHEGRTSGLELRPRRIAGLGAPTESLDRRIAQRTREMLDAGWMEEALRIRAGCGFGATASQALGYAEVLQLADGQIEREECERVIALRTRQFARKQRTWLRKFPEIEWLEAPGVERGSRTQQDLAEIVDEVLLRWRWS